ncbi:hypothetical protein [Streptomyces spinosisporus]|uniref:Uncharacterized protein n=1 Tax=Streptomyces spinosisporus TaxID=2927582 RepID=A0ABS9XWW5_9ACTN|nr:hypothetical protein [Streptomyces spinosisporus]MCI3246560.1 hypothetical protein [Streptomyces spinosisporus]
MSQATSQRLPNGHRSCRQEHPHTHVHCTQPASHPPRDGNGGHWQSCPRTSW